MGNSHMHRYTKLACLAALPIWAGACTDFLTGGELSVDPNRPVQANADLLFAGVQSTQWINQTSEDARTIAMWMQQMAGTDRQYQSLGTYASFTEGSFHGFDDVYAGGGLVDLRRIQELADESPGLGRVYKGVAQVLEALAIGTAASIYGDIPYSEAVSDVQQPRLDPQLEVYDALQALLDEAIANLQSGQGTGPAADLVYGGNPAKWAELAHTLKARFFMHTAEVRGQSAYQGVLANVPEGISTPANNYRTVHSGSAGEQNPWYQFIVIERTGYISAGEHLVELLKARSDPRLQLYYSPGADGVFRGAPPGGTFSDQLSNLSTQRLAPAFSQPIVTHGENLLLWAEAAFQTGNTAVALQKLNEARALFGLGPLSPAPTGADLFREIMLEKYIQLFQNIEVWNDYKRTCIPNLAPAAGFGGIIPARAYYPTDERQTNENIPPPEDQPLRNANDPAGGTPPGPDAAACLGQ